MTSRVLIAGVLLLGAAPLAAQLSPNRPSAATPGASPDRTADPDTAASPAAPPSAGSPASSDVHAIPPSTETSAPSVEPKDSDEAKAGGGARPRDRSR